MNVNPRLAQLLGLFLLLIAAAMTYLVYLGVMAIPEEPSLLLVSGIVAWGILALPELAVGLWLIIKGTHGARTSQVSDRLVQLVQREGRISVEAAARELGVESKGISDAALGLAKRRIPLVLIDRASSDIISPGTVTLKEGILHLLFAQRRMTFDQISSVTKATHTQIIDALKELSKEGKFRGVIDENSQAVYTSEALAHLPKSYTKCPECGGKLANPVFPGEEEVCPYCGHLIVNRMRIKGAV